MAVHQLPELPSALWGVPLLLAAFVVLRYDRLRPLLVLAAAVVWTCWCAGERLAERLPVDGARRRLRAHGLGRRISERSAGANHVSIRRCGAAAARCAAARPPHVVRPAGDGRPGDALAVTARLRPPRGARNPGGFDYERWLLVNGYGATGYVRSGACRQRRAAMWGQGGSSFAASSPSGSVLRAAMPTARRC